MNNVFFAIELYARHSRASQYENGRPAARHAIAGISAGGKIITIIILITTTIINMYGVYLYVFAVVLEFSSAGRDGRFLGTLYERFKEGIPAHFTPGTSFFSRIFSLSN